MATEVKNKRSGDDRQTERRRQDASAPKKQGRNANRSEHAGQQRDTATGCDQRNAGTADPEWGTVDQEGLPVFVAKSAG